MLTNVSVRFRIVIAVLPMEQIVKFAQVIIISCTITVMAVGQMEIYIVSPVNCLAFVLDHIAKAAKVGPSSPIMMDIQTTHIAPSAKAPVRPARTQPLA